MSLPCSSVELRVYDRDGTTLRDTVSATGAQFSDLLGDVGSATLSVPLMQSVMQSNPDLLSGAIVKVATNLVADGPMVEIFGFLAEGGDWSLIGDAEDAGKERGLQCRGLLALMDDWVVYPETGLKAHSGDQRAFGWMSAESTEWFDTAQWTGTVHGTAWKDIPSTSDRYRKPKGWPDPKAQWVGTNGKEKQYFRTKVTVSEDTTVRVYASADESLRVYLDSELIISNKSRELGYTELNHWHGVLSAGTHVFGVYFLKEYNPDALANWAGAGYNFDDTDKMIFSCCSLKPNGAVKDVLRRSNETSWLAVGLDDGQRPPTWTAAGIVGKLLAEARARGVDSASRVAPTFSHSTDSDGNAWPDLQERSWPVGTSGGQVLADLGELDVDFDMAQDLQLLAYATQGTDKSATVTITKGVNVLSYKAGVTPLIATSLLVRSNNRWVEVTDSAAEAVSDRREGFLETGGSLSRDQAKRVANRALDDLSSDRTSYTAEIIAVGGCVPYHDFGKGDTIMAYDTALTATPLRVVSISGDVPDEGPIRWTLELEAV